MDDCYEERMLPSFLAELLLLLSFVFVLFSLYLIGLIWGMIFKLIGWASWLFLWTTGFFCFLFFCLVWFFFGFSFVCFCTWERKSSP